MLRPPLFSTCMKISSVKQNDPVNLKMFYQHYRTRLKTPATSLSFRQLLPKAGSLCLGRPSWPSPGYCFSAGHGGQPSGDCHFTQRLPSYPVFILAFASCTAAGSCNPSGSGLSRWKSGGPGWCGKPEGGNLKYMPPSTGLGLSFCAPGSPKAKVPEPQV